MRLDEIVAWYQKKIGTYDKQQWEKTIEQRILNGFTHVPLRNTKLKTELIDVDLVRGSTFPKAKPKQSLLTVLYLAALRIILLPIYAKWWVNQTSPKVFVFLLTLYLLQMFNWGVYSYNVHKIDSTDHIVSISEFIIPMALSLLLTAIHSQIVATASNTQTADKMKNRFSLNNVNNLISGRKKRERIKKRKKNVRIPRNNNGNEPKISTTLTTNILVDNNSKTNCSATAPVNKSCNNQSSMKLCDINLVNNSKFKRNNKETDINTKAFDKCKDTDIKSKVLLNTKETNNQPLDDCGNKQKEMNPNSVTMKDKLQMDNEMIVSAENIPCVVPLPPPSSILRKRNVYWDSPIRSHVFTSGSNFEKVPNIDTKDNQPPLTPNRSSTGDDDGFESLNGKSSSGEDINVSGVCAGQDDTRTQQKIPYTNSWLQDLTEKCDIPKLSSGSDTDTLKTSLNAGECIAESTPLRIEKPSAINLLKLNPKQYNKLESSDTDEENDECEQLLTPTTDVTTSATERVCVTTNSEDCSYSSGMNQSDSQNDRSEDDLEFDVAPTTILNSSCGASDRVSCTVWERREAKKAELTVLDISSAIIERVEAMPETCDYMYIGLALSVFLSLIPTFCRLCEVTVDSSNSSEVNYLDIPVILFEKASFSFMTIFTFAFGETTWEKTVLGIGFVLRLCLTFIFFFLLTVAERTFKQKFLYAKLFSHLTSSRRARKSDIPHFRLNKVRNIKTWLSVRSYLKRRGPQRSVDVIVSAAFITTLLLLTFLSVEWLKDSVHLHSQFNLEALIWSCSLGVFLLRFMTLGTKINKKYKSVSVLITEQINLYVQIEQKPQKKEELMVSNSVLKLASDLLKELESPFKISGLSANPYLYTTVKVVILSAMSGVLSEMLGFKLKLHKIKIK